MIQLTLRVNMMIVRINNVFYLITSLHPDNITLFLSPPLHITIKTNPARALQSIPHKKNIPGTNSPNPHATILPVLCPRPLHDGGLLFPVLCAHDQTACIVHDRDASGWGMGRGGQATHDHAVDAPAVCAGPDAPNAASVAGERWVA